MEHFRDNLVERQKNQTVLVLLLSIVLLVLLNAVSWWYLYRTRDILDSQFGSRLMVTGRAVLLDTDNAQLENALLLDDEIAVLLLQQHLEEQKKEYGLERILFTGPVRRIALGTENILLGQPLASAVRLDSALASRLTDGMPVTTPLYRIADSYFKAAVLPVKDRFGSTIGLVCVEASARFLETIHRLRRGLLVGGSISAAIIILFILFLGLSLRRLLHIQETLAENRRMALLGGLASRVTHEIRNPLGIIKSTADLIKRRYAPADNAPEEFDYINDEVRRLNGLITSFLTYAGEKQPDLRPLDMAAFLKDLESSLTAECRKRDTSFSLDTSSVCPGLQADPDSLKQVILNLVLNALDAVPEKGSVSVTAGPGALEGIAGCVVSVSDNGPGIPADAMEKLFTPFFSTKPSGTGLGLAISRKIIEQHGGRIAADGSPEGGARIRFILPVKK